MSTIRTNDLVFAFHGGFPFSQVFPIENDIDIKAYTAARDKLSQGRSLLLMSRGADADVGANVSQVLAEVSTITKGKFETIGQVCILGRSNGCSLALGLAAELHSRGVAELTFVGLSDVTMFASGRVPSVPRIGSLQPKSDPIATAAKSPSIRERVTGGPQQPVPETAVPVITLDTSIKTSQGKINHFQIQGNHMKYAKSVNRWIWFSDMTDGEVHGEVEGFVNRKLDATGNSDLALHINLNTQEHWKRLGKEASAALAKFPPDAT